MKQVSVDESMGNQRKSQISVITDIKARIMTTGGVLIFAVVIILTLVFVLNLLFPRGNGLQFAVIVVLVFISWGFFLNCLSERLKLTKDNLIFTSLFGRATIISIEEITSYKLTDLGAKFDGNKYLLEVEHEGKLKPEQIWLSHCWDFKELKDFCKSLELIVDQY